MVVLAQDESRALKHDFLGVEHLVLGLLREGESAALLGVSLDAARDAARARLGESERAPQGQIPFTPEAKKSLELALRAAQALADNFIAPAHVLLGVAGTEGGGDFLVLLGVDVGALRDRVGATPRRGPRAERGRWEYRVEEFEQLDSDWLTGIGREGWDLVDIVGTKALFKRRA